MTRLLLEEKLSPKVTDEVISLTGKMSQSDKRVAVPLGIAFRPKLVLGNEMT